jgi:hypothetical protein
MEALAHNSTDGRRKHLFDSIGIWFFAAAIFCEIGAYRYGQRNDDLSQQVIISLDNKAQDAFTNASNAFTNAGEADTKADVANDKSGKAQDIANAANRTSRQANRTAESAETLGSNIKIQLEIASAELRALQKNTEYLAKGQGQRALPDEPIKAELRKSPTGRLLILYQESSDESYMVADQLRGDIGDAGWNVPAKPSPFKSTVDLFPKCGMSAHDILLVTKEPANGVGQNPAQAMHRAVMAMAHSGYVRSFAFCVDDRLPEDTVEIYVSPRP